MSTSRIFNLTDMNHSSEKCTCSDHNFLAFDYFIRGLHPSYFSFIIDLEV